MTFSIQYLVYLVPPVLHLDHSEWAYYHQNSGYHSIWHTQSFSLSTCIVTIYCTKPILVHDLFIQYDILLVGSILLCSSQNRYPKSSISYPMKLYLVDLSSNLVLAIKWLWTCGTQAKIYRKDKFISFSLHVSLEILDLLGMLQYWLTWTWSILDNLKLTVKWDLRSWRSVYSTFRLYKLNRYARS